MAPIRSVNVVLVASLLALVGTVSAKVFTNCELAKALLNTYGFPRDQIATWVCIAHYESSLNTSYEGVRYEDGSHDYGLWGFNSRFWCKQRNWSNRGCNVTCDKFVDDDITDDTKCLKTIYNKNAHTMKNGYASWTFFWLYCNPEVRAEFYIADCDI